MPSRSKTEHRIGGNAQAMAGAGHICLMENRDRQFYFMRAVKDSTKESPLALPPQVIPITPPPHRIVNGTQHPTFHPTKSTTTTTNHHDRWHTALDELFLRKSSPRSPTISTLRDPGGCKLESPFVISLGPRPRRAGVQLPLYHGRPTEENGKRSTTYGRWTTVKWAKGANG